MEQSEKKVDRQFYRNNILSKLRIIQQQSGSTILYQQQTADSILRNLISPSEIFGVGFNICITKDTIEERDMEKVVIVGVLDDQGLLQVERYQHLFTHISLLNLKLSSSSEMQTIKVSPIRKKLRVFLQISLNFHLFVHPIFAANSPQSKTNVTFTEGLTSFLTSTNKFHQYSIQFSKSERNSIEAAKIEQQLKDKLSILEKHKSSEYKENSSPRLKVLLIDHGIDQMSNLVYSYFFGPIVEELHLLDSDADLRAKSWLYERLFAMDIQEAGEYLMKISDQKATTRKQTLQKMETNLIKKAIAMSCDQQYSPRQLQIQIQSLSAVKEFCKRRALTSSLQQTILNNISEEGEKMSPSKIINRIISWASQPLEQFKPSEQDYIKILILTYMINDLWFFQRKIINAPLKDHPRKQQIISFCKKIENSYKALKQKPQGQDRFDLYRHLPAIVSQIDAWFEKKKSFEQKSINKSSANRQSRFVIAVNGPLGYNQACFIIRYLREKKMDNVSIFCEKLVTTKDYVEWLLSRNK